MEQGLERLAGKTNHFLQLLGQERQQLPAPFVWAGLEFAASINAWVLERHHEATSHLQRQKAELRRSAATVQETSDQVSKIDLNDLLRSFASQSRDLVSSGLAESPKS